MKRSPKLKPTKWDALVVLAVLLLTLGLGARPYFAAKSAGELTVSVAIDGETVEADPAKAAATKVVATVIEQFKGEKVLVFKFKKRKNYKKLRGHRQQLTRVEIKSVGTAVAE